MIQVYIPEGMMCTLLCNCEWTTTLSYSFTLNRSTKIFAISVEGSYIHAVHF